MCPPRVMRPASGVWMPVSTLISVDLPAPFSPTSAWISPRSSEKFTSSRARTPAKVLVKPATSITGPADGSVGIGELLLGVRGVVLVVGDHDVLRDLVALAELLQRVERERPEPRVRLDHRGVAAVRDQLHVVARAVDGHDLDVLAGLLAR